MLYFAMVNWWEVFIGTTAGFVFLFVIAAWVSAYHKKRNTTRLFFPDILKFLNGVDLNDFAALVDPREEAILRASRSRVEFGEIQAGRIAAARTYLHAMMANATALQELGYKFLHSGEHPINPGEPGRPRHRRCRERCDCRQDTTRWLAYRLVNSAVAVKMGCRSALFALWFWRRRLILDHVLISPSLADLKDVTETLFESYQELRQTALVLARYANSGIEAEMVTRI